MVFQNAMVAGHVSEFSLLSAASVLCLLWSATELRQAQAAPSVQIPVIYYYSIKAFDECGWTCNSFSGSCYSWEYEWVCIRNAGYEDGGDLLRFSPTDFEVLDMSLNILQNFTSDNAMYSKLTDCIRKSVNYPEVILYQESVDQVPSQQAGDSCSTESECTARASIDFAHAMWFAKSWPAISIVPWYESTVNGDSSGSADAVAFVNEVQRQVRFIDSGGLPDKYTYPQTAQWWGDAVVVNINRAWIDLYVKGGNPCWNPMLSGASKWESCNVDGDIADFSSCKHCAARSYAGAWLLPLPA